MEKEHLIRLTTNLYQITILFPKKEPLRYKMREVADDILANFIRAKIHSNPSLKALDNIDQLLDDLEIIDSFFAIAEEQNWVSPEKLLSIWEEYSKIKQYAKELNEQNSCHFLVEVRQDKKEISEVTAPKEQIEKVVDEAVASSSATEHPKEAKVRKGMESSFDFAIARVKKEPTGSSSSRQEKIVEFLKQNGKAQVGEFKEVFPEVTKRTLRRDFWQLFREGKIERMGEKNDTFYQIKEVGHINR